MDDILYEKLNIFRISVYKNHLNNIIDKYYTNKERDELLCLIFGFEFEPNMY